jgi:hypothetical protein
MNATIAIPELFVIVTSVPVLITLYLELGTIALTTSRFEQKYNAPSDLPIAIKHTLLYLSVVDIPLLIAM